MSEDQIRAELSRARSRVFEVPEAQDDIRRLKRKLFRCPEFKARQARRKALADERMLARWQ
ncbi:MAG: hypothetical protein ACYS7Y_20200 [Planctomycetota bacterium]|jgi:hypothetical protein